MFKKACPRGGGESVQQGPLAYYVLEGVSFVLAASRRGQPLCDARSVLSVREHKTMATCLREAATAKAENAAGGFFQHSHRREDGLV